MARKVFFSFHYERDAWRAGQVRNCNVLPSEDQVGFIDSVDWESIKKQGDEAIERWINKQLDGTSVTAVLIGTETANREWVQYEILQSWKRGNGLVGISIHNVKDADKRTDVQGTNPFEKFKLPSGKLLSSVCKVYDWVTDNGRDNLGPWLDDAVEIRAESDGDGRIMLLEKKATDILANAAVAVGAVALGALAARALSSPPESASPSRPSQFAPRAPWSTENDHH